MKPTGKARAAAREYMKFYLRLPAYQKHLDALRFNRTELANGGSDWLVDAIIAWRDETKRQKSFAGAGVKLEVD